MNVASHPPDLRAIDIHLARFLTKLSGRDRPEIFLAVFLVSAAAREGNVCLDLTSLAGRPILVDTPDSCPQIAPELEEWCRILRDSRIVGKPGDFTPLILDDHLRLYLYRYWDAEKQTVDFFKRRQQYEKSQREAGRESGAVSRTLLGLKNRLDRLFPRGIAEGADWQQIAAVLALFNDFTIITGSPGTGKTTTVLKILALLVEQAQGRPLRMALAAPTGKAAARLQEAIGRAKETLDCCNAVIAAIPQNASTLHRLLGSLSDAPSFRHNRRNPLPIDVLIVDEASMVDLPLMAKLIAAIPEGAKLILIGDRDQLASVDAGAVLGDLCGRGPLNRFSCKLGRELEKTLEFALPGDTRLASVSGMQDHIVELVKNYRFGEGSEIGRVSMAIVRNDVEGVMAIMKDSHSSDMQWSPLPSAHSLETAFTETIIKGFEEYMQHLNNEGELSILFQSFDRFRILCALREGPFGAANINRLVENILRRDKLIKTDNRWYIGRPVMIMKNDYQLRLFNGDTGIILSEGGNRAEPVALFRDPAGTFRKFPPPMLPEHETAFAMTIHKSQGSEFDRIMIILPDRDSPLLTRELLYTAISRAKKSVSIWGQETLLRNALARRIVRTSGLWEALWGFTSEPDRR